MGGAVTPNYTMLSKYQEKFTAFAISFTVILLVKL